MIATITLNPSIDQHLVVKGLLKDDANRAVSIQSFPGGKGVNVSKVVRELGGPTCAYATSGGFVGRYWTELLKKLDIAFWTLSVEGDTRVNTILTDEKDLTQTRISAPGPQARREDISKFLKKACTVRPKPFLWALGGSLSKGMPAATYRRFIEALQAGGVPCILDADDEPLREGVKAKPFMIKPNEFEMRRLMGRTLSSVKDYLEAARHMAGEGVGLVVVSLGEKGALFVTRQKAFHVQGLRVPVKSKVGAGDSMIGGFALGLYRGWSVERAAALGIAASASAVMREAPRLCLRRDIPKLLKKVTWRPL